MKRSKLPAAGVRARQLALVALVKEDWCLGGVRPSELRLQARYGGLIEREQALRLIQGRKADLQAQERFHILRAH